jgi:cytochrome P450
MVRILLRRHSLSRGPIFKGDREDARYVSSLYHTSTIAAESKYFNSYGSIVRVNPDELHIRDSSQYEVVYTGRRDKWPPVAKLAGNTVSTFSTIEHDLHRKRRAINMPMFAKAVVNGNTDIIRGQLKKMLRSFDNAAEDGTVLDLSLIFLAFTTDVASTYVLDVPLGMQDDLDGKATQWRNGTRQISANTPLVKQFPWLSIVINLIPLAVWKAVSPGVASLLGIYEWTRSEAKRFIEAMEADTSQSRVMKKTTRKDTKLFRALWESFDDDPENRTLLRLSEEANTLMVAGSETTARILCRAVYEILENPEALATLRRELDQARTQRGREVSDLTLSELDHFPWLTGVIKETLRISALVASRLPLQPHEPLQYKEWTIPAMVRLIAR